MKFVFVSYVASMGFTDPYAWLKRINMYGGVLEQLALTDTVISIEQIDYEGQLKHNGVQYYFKKFTKNQRIFPRKLHRFIAEQQPDVVLVQGLLFPIQVIQLRLHLGNKVKIILQNHAEKPFTGLKKRLQQLADVGVDAYLFASQTMGEGWVKAGNLRRADKIHEVMEVSSIFHPISKSCAVSKTDAEGSPIFLWIGRLNANKDPLNVVKAFLLYAAVNPLAKLYMIYQTDDLLSQIQAILNENPNVKNNIVLVGRIPHDDLLYWYNSADYIISGSFYEGSGTAACEAMSCGCIPIVTDIDSYRMITDNGNCGILYEAGNEQALLKSLNSLKHLNQGEMRKKVLAYYDDKLSFKAIAGRFREIGTTLLS